jgi:hypothetical protein
MRSATCIVLVSCLAVPVASLAQVVTIEHEGGDEPVVYRMTVSPAPEPKPALKFRFLVPAVDQTHGNAATLFYKAMSFEGRYNEIDATEATMRDDEKNRLFWEAPLDEFPQKQAEDITRWLAAGTGYGTWLRQAARCDYCDWEESIREQGINTPLPQAQYSRGLANVLALRARLQIAGHHQDEAIENLRIGYVLGHDIAKGPTVIHCLIGIAIQDHIMDPQTRTLMAAENSPNLYWALTDLSSHPIDFRDALSFESKLWEFTIHEMPDLHNRVFSAEEALHVAEELQKTVATGYGRPRIAEFGPSGILAMAVAQYPHAREYLLDHGYTAERIEAMPVVQTVLLAWWRQFQFVRDDSFKWLTLPDDERRANMKRSDDAVMAASRAGQGTLFTDLLPGLQATASAYFRSRRLVDLLRIVEALRMYAADHGRWPERLEDITEVSIPIDPWTQKPFEYSVENGVASIQAPANPPMAGGQTSNARYELTLRSAAK